MCSRVYRQNVKNANVIAKLRGVGGLYSNDVTRTPLAKNSRTWWDIMSTKSQLDRFLPVLISAVELRCYKEYHNVRSGSLSLPCVTSFIKMCFSYSVCFQHRTCSSIELWIVSRKCNCRSWGISGNTVCCPTVCILLDFRSLCLLWFCPFLEKRWGSPFRSSRTPSIICWRSPNY